MFKRIYHFVVDKKISTLSGALCFFLLLNGGSFFFLLISLSNYLFIDIVPYIEKILTENASKDVIMYLLKHNAGLPISIFLLLTSLYSSSSLYYHYLNVIEIITSIPIKYNLSKRLLSLLIVPISLLLFIIIISLIYFSTMSSLFYIVLSFFVFLIIYLLNMISLKQNFKRIIKGSVFSFIYILIFTIMFILFVKINTSFKEVYGIFSIIIILFFYLYSVTIGLMLGIYMNWKNIEVSYFLKNE